jgi:two-component system, sensor histidine kinase and response regulator
LDVGMQDHIAKPLNIGEMFTTLARWIHPSAGKAQNLPANEVNANADVLPELAGIDTHAGLATTMNNASLYRRLLKKFLESQGGFAQMFEAAQHSDDASAPARLAHTLKGTAGNIGAKGIQAAAGELEAACLANASAATIDNLLSDVLQELEPVVISLKKLETAKEAVNTAQAGTIDKELLRTQTARLKQLLLNSDAEVSDLWEAHADIFKVAYPNHWRQIEAGLSNFDFDIALTYIEAAEQEHSI